jgi:hydroxymethylpyrimidine pyrophosphatase-like HAD family hydrolase
VASSGDELQVSQRMRYRALASDYDGTLARDGVVSPATVEAVQRLRNSGRKLILVTGRELPDLQNVFHRLDLFERVVAENGALLYEPQTCRKRVLGQRPPEKFLQEMKRHGVQHVSSGEVIVATSRAYEEQTMAAIRESGLELQLIFNKDALMILPSGTDKMTGLRAALEELSLSWDGAVGIGDAENDFAFLDACACAVAVANAIPALKARADVVTKADDGAGVVELIQNMIENDLAEIRSQNSIRAPTCPVR